MPSEHTSFPPFVDFSRVGELWQERSSLIAQHAEEWRQTHQIPPSKDDHTRIAMFGIDCQVGFVHPGAALEVPGAREDMVRASQFLYNNLPKITHLLFSLDTHSPFQVFHPGFWHDDAGNQPKAFTPISHQDITSGKWHPLQQPELMADYTQQLEENAHHQLMVWPYHCLLGGLSHALVPLVMEAALFHSFVRNNQPHFELKGMHPMTENYSVFEPEVKTLKGQSVGTFQQALFDQLMSFDRVYVWGEASSHCVRATLESLTHKIAATEPTWLQKIYILEDCMSPIPATPNGPDFPLLTQQFMQRCAEQGMQIAKSTDPIT